VVSAGQTAGELARPIADALAAGNMASVRDLARGLQAPDLADLVELLQPDERVRLVQALGAAFDPEVLSELDETVRDQLSEALPNDVLAKAVARLETDDAAYVIEGLEKADQQEILAQIPDG
jgi:magnesium transporter